jgi:formamidopyrimidine-DNA glycosylase
VPELVEVERARAVLEAWAVGRTVAAVEDHDPYVCRPHAPGDIDAALRDLTVTAARRRGKSMWLELAPGGVTLGLHLGMAGSIKVNEPVPDRPWDRFAITFTDGTRIALRDKRRLSRAVLEPGLSRVGPDAAEIGRDAFRAAAGTGRAPVKARLLDQRRIAGVGNLLADEALWQARIAPLRPADELTADDLDRLRRALRAAIRSATRLGGVHTGRLIPHRRRGGSCPHCGEPLARGVVGGRTTWWCPAEQP